MRFQKKKGILGSTESLLFGSEWCIGVRVLQMNISSVCFNFHSCRTVRALSAKTLLLAISSSSQKTLKLVLQFYECLSIEV